MILPDVNVLVYAFRREAEHHERYADWLARLVAGADELALHDTDGCRVATADRGFSRFPGVRTFDVGPGGPRGVCRARAEGLAALIAGVGRPYPRG